MKHFLLSAFLFLAFCSSAQTIGRVKIQGNIQVPSDSDAEGITIFNKNSNRGTVSSENGDFEIAVVVGDSLYFSALQFKDLLVVVDQKTFDSEMLKVEIAEGVNELPEVVIRPHDLTGNLKNDLENIVTQPVAVPDSSGLIVNEYDYRWAADAQTAVHNPAAGESGVPSTALNILAILGGIVDAILPDKKKKEKKILPRGEIGIIQLERELRKRYDNAFFEEVLELELSEIPDFVIFIEKDLNDDLLQEQRSFELMDFLVTKSRSYRREK